jgi:outer membrane immunogenic protein
MAFCVEGEIRMKRLLLASVTLFALVSGMTAHAADMPLKAAPYAAPAPLWSGWFFGGNVGYGLGVKTDPSVTFVNPAGIGGLTNFLNNGGNMFPNTSPDGVVGGLQLGYNWQVGAWVYGVVTDIQASTISQSATTVTPVVPTGANLSENLSASIDWFGTVRGKLGWAAGNWLFYGTGGLAYGKVATDLRFFCTPGGTGCGGVNLAGHTDETKAGWTAGGGIDYAISNYVTVGAEYLYLDLGRSSVTGSQVPLFATTVVANPHFAAHIARATINWHFAP